MREIKELISLEDAKKLIGATVQGVSTRDSGVLRDACDRGIVRSVSIDGDGDLEFVLDNFECVFVTESRVRDSWHLEVIQEPPTAGPVRLDENTPLEELQRYVGAIVWERLSFEGCDESRNASDTFTVLAAVRRDCGELYLSGQDEGWFLSDGDYAIVLQDPPQATETPDEEPSTETLTERVERLKGELKAAEAALASEWVPDGWTLAADAWARSPRIDDQSGASILWNNSSRSEVFIQRDRGSYTAVEFRAIAAWVDHVRAENPDT